MYNLKNIYLDPERTHALVQYIDNSDMSYYYHIPIVNVHELIVNQSYKVLETHSGKVRYINFKAIDPLHFIDMDVTGEPQWVELIAKSEKETANNSIKACEIMGISVPTFEQYGIVYYRNGTTTKMTYLEIHELLMVNRLNYILIKRTEEEWLSII